MLWLQSKNFVLSQEYLNGGNRHLFGENGRTAAVSQVAFCPYGDQVHLDATPVTDLCETVASVRTAGTRIASLAVLRAGGHGQNHPDETTTRPGSG